MRNVEVENSATMASGPMTASELLNSSRQMTARLESHQLALAQQSEALHSIIGRMEATPTTRRIQANTNLPAPNDVYRPPSSASLAAAERPAETYLQARNRWEEERISGSLMVKDVYSSAPETSSTKSNATVVPGTTVLKSVYSAPSYNATMLALQRTENLRDAVRSSVQPTLTPTTSITSLHMNGDEKGSLGLSGSFRGGLNALSASERRQLVSSRRDGPLQSSRLSLTRPSNIETKTSIRSLTELLPTAIPHTTSSSGTADVPVARYYNAASRTARLKSDALEQTTAELEHVRTERLTRLEARVDSHRSALARLTSMRESALETAREDNALQIAEGYFVVKAAWRGLRSLFLWARRGNLKRLSKIRAESFLLKFTLRRWQRWQRREFMLRAISVLGSEKIVTRRFYHRCQQRSYFSASSAAKVLQADRHYIRRLVRKSICRLHSITPSAVERSWIISKERFVRTALLRGMTTLRMNRTRKLAVHRQWVTVIRPIRLRRVASAACQLMADWRQRIVWRRRMEMSLHTRNLFMFSTVLRCWRDYTFRLSTVQRSSFRRGARALLQRKTRNAIDVWKHWTSSRVRKRQLIVLNPKRVIFHKRIGVARRAFRHWATVASTRWQKFLSTQRRFWPYASRLQERLVASLSSTIRNTDELNLEATKSAIMSTNGGKCPSTVTVASVTATRQKLSFELPNGPPVQTFTTNSSRHIAISSSNQHTTPRVTPASKLVLGSTCDALMRFACVKRAWYSWCCRLVRLAAVRRLTKATLSNSEANRLRSAIKRWYNIVEDRIQRRQLCSQSRIRNHAVIRSASECLREWRLWAKLSHDCMKAVRTALRKCGPLRICWKRLSTWTEIRILRRTHHVQLLESGMMKSKQKLSNHISLLSTGSSLIQPPRLTGLVVDARRRVLHIWYLRSVLYHRREDILKKSSKIGFGFLMRRVVRIWRVKCASTAGKEENWQKARYIAGIIKCRRFLRRWRKFVCAVQHIRPGQPNMVSSSETPLPKTATSLLNHQISRSAKVPQKNAPPSSIVTTLYSDRVTPVEPSVRENRSHVSRFENSPILVSSSQHVQTFDFTPRVDPPHSLITVPSASEDISSFVLPPRPPSVNRVKRHPEEHLVRGVTPTRDAHIRHDTYQQIRLGHEDNHLNHSLSVRQTPTVNVPTNIYFEKPVHSWSEFDADEQSDVISDDFSFGERSYDNQNKANYFSAPVETPPSDLPVTMEPNLSSLRNSAYQIQRVEDHQISRVVNGSNSSPPNIDQVSSLIVRGVDAIKYHGSVIREHAVFVRWLAWQSVVQSQAISYHKGRRLSTFKQLRRSLRHWEKWSKTCAERNFRADEHWKKDVVIRRISFLWPRWKARTETAIAFEDSIDRAISLRYSRCLRLALHSWKHYTEHISRHTRSTNELAVSVKNHMILKEYFSRLHRQTCTYSQECSHHQQAAAYYHKHLIHSAVNQWKRTSSNGISQRDILERATTHILRVSLNKWRGGHMALKLKSTKTALQNDILLAYSDTKLHNVAVRFFDIQRRTILSKVQNDVAREWANRRLLGRIFLSWKESIRCSLLEDENECIIAENNGWKHRNIVSFFLKMKNALRRKRQSVFCDNFASELLIRRYWKEGWQRGEWRSLRISQYEVLQKAINYNYGRCLKFGWEKFTEAITERRIARSAGEKSGDRVRIVVSSTRKNVIPLSSITAASKMRTAFKQWKDMWFSELVKKRHELVTVASRHYVRSLARHTLRVWRDRFLRNRHNAALVLTIASIAEEQRYKRNVLRILRRRVAVSALETRNRIAIATGHMRRLLRRWRLHTATNVPLCILRDSYGEVGLTESGEPIPCGLSIAHETSAALVGDPNLSVSGKWSAATTSTEVATALAGRIATKFIPRNHQYDAISSADFVRRCRKLRSTLQMWMCFSNQKISAADNISLASSWNKRRMLRKSLSRWHFARFGDDIANNRAHTSMMVYSHWRRNSLNTFFNRLSKSVRLRDRYDLARVMWRRRILRNDLKNWLRSTKIEQVKFIHSEKRIRRRVAILFSRWRNFSTWQRHLFHRETVLGIVISGDDSEAFVSAAMTSGAQRHFIHTAYERAFAALHEHVLLRRASRHYLRTGFTLFSNAVNSCRSSRGYHLAVNKRARILSPRLYFGRFVRAFNRRRAEREELILDRPSFVETMADPIASAQNGDDVAQSLKTRKKFIFSTDGKRVRRMHQLLTVRASNLYSSGECVTGEGAIFSAIDDLRRSKLLRSSLLWFHQFTRMERRNRRRELLQQVIMQKFALRNVFKAMSKKLLIASRRRKVYAEADVGKLELSLRMAFAKLDMNAANHWRRDQSDRLSSEHSRRAALRRGLRIWSHCTSKNAAVRPPTNI